MVVKPSTPDDLSVEKVNDDSIRIVWDDSSNSVGTTYEVYMNVDVGTGRFELIKEVSEPRHTVAKNIGAKAYKFKVVAKNSCGRSAESEQLLWNDKFKPDKMQSPRVRVDPKKCSVRFSWVKPADGGSSLEEYKLEIRDSNRYKWHRVESCGT